MDWKPRRRPPLSLIAAALAGQAVITAAVIAVLSMINAPGAPPSAGPRSAAPAPAGTRQLPREALPRYYAALTGAPASRLHATDIIIRDTVSGTALATVRPPAPYPAFTMVAATASASAWVVAASQATAPPQGLGSASGFLGSGQTRLYLLAFSPVTRSTRLGPLPVPAMNGPDIWGAALSPDGRQLAVAVQPTESVHQVRVYALARAAAGAAQPGGRLRATWTATGRGPFAFGEQSLNPQTLSWSADDRTVAFNWQGPQAGLRLLDTRGAGGSLIAASRLAVAVPGRDVACLGALVLTSDGHSVLCAGVENGTARGGQAATDIAWFSAATGRLASQLIQPRAPVGATLLWVSPAGTVIVAGQWQAGGRLAAMSVIGPGYTRAIPLPPAAGQVAW
jgi:hypothetical protein